VIDRGRRVQSPQLGRAPGEGREGHYCLPARTVFREERGTSKNFVTCGVQQKKGRLGAGENGESWLSRQGKKKWKGREGTFE